VGSARDPRTLRFLVLTHKVLTAGNRLLPFCIIDLGGVSGYLRVISPHSRKNLARKILLADDSVTAQNMGRKILADAGYEVITVNNGSAALKKIAELKPDLIVLDVYMPGYSGLEVCQRLKESQETSRYPVLLTVGKLEPFKPEEAKRVRADGFIVKPFEASELLSALSKLEDKIVPRQETSKPGRFARVSTAIEEGRYDKTVAVEEDTGWKNRIAFPAKKKEKVAEEDADDQDAYNFAKKEASFADQKLAEKTRAAKVDEAKVDLGALAAEGLPKDVTPEEIAALAAAAARMKGKIGDSRFEEPVPIEASTEQQTYPAAPLPQEVTSETPTATFAAQDSEAKIEETVGEKIEAKAEEKFEEKTGTPDGKSSAVEAASIALSTPSDAIAATVGREPGIAASPSATLENGSPTHETPDHTANEPATMAVAAGAGSYGHGTRWTAVSVALDADEAALSLEHEMRKAYAAFAAAENAHATSDPQIPEFQSQPAEVTAATETPTPVGAPLIEAAIPTSTMTVPEAAQTLSALVHPSTEIIRAAVQELEMVSEVYVGESAVSTGLESGPANTVEAATQHAPEAPQPVEATAGTAVEPQPESAIEPTKGAESESWREELKESKSDDLAPQEHEHEEPARNEEPSAPVAPAFVHEVSAEGSSAGPMSSDLAPVPASEPAEGKAMPKHESDAAATTAAAWASWRQIRDSGNPTRTHNVAENMTSEGTAAMAVAAGAENTPEEASGEAESDPAAIASIVDSVLADMRPKIFEEISRKMNKKK
jgi:two-component system, chemotaxis family, chemotaxis protein CheY